MPNVIRQSEAISPTQQKRAIVLSGPSSVRVSETEAVEVMEMVVMNSPLLAPICSGVGEVIGPVYLRGIAVHRY
jgi:hypothetical protein